MMRPAEQAEIEQWNQLIAKNPDGGNPLQVEPFASVKKSHGWQDSYWTDGQGLYVMALTRRLPYFGSYTYIPGGPGTADAAAAAKVIQDIGTQIGSFVVKADPEIEESESSVKALSKAGLVKGRDIQFNRGTIVVDLRPEEEAILASFKQKTRYNIRLAERKGVTVRAAEPDDTNLGKMYELMSATKERAGFYLRDFEYFHDFWTLHQSAGCGQLFFAEFEGEVLAGVFATFSGSHGLYKDGGSTRNHANLQAPYLLQWEVMRWLKRYGVEYYDMHGVPPKNAGEDHPLASLAQFKSGFNPEPVQYVGAWDLPLDPMKYRLWLRFGERLATSYTYRVKKELFY